MANLYRDTGSGRHFPALARTTLQTLQLNLGYLCNQACAHCHVDAGPKRTEIMGRATIDAALDFVGRNALQTVDLTGGAPELNPNFRYLVSALSAAGVDVIDRCNLTVLNEPGQSGLANFLAEQRVRVVASLPCYAQENVDKQRGNGVFASSLRGIQQLNAFGYGRDGSGLQLDFVYNPQGGQLPPDPAVLEAQYRQELAAFGIEFNRLLTITNVPIKRFRRALEHAGELESYMDMLVQSFAAENMQHVMCRTLLSVDWLGFVYDCDFNQMLGTPAGGQRRHISEVAGNEFAGVAVAVADHCFACTAGRGSSCGGALRS